MEKFKNILKEACLIVEAKKKVILDCESSQDLDKIVKFLKKAEISNKKITGKNSPVLEITFDDDLQRAVILQSLKKDVRAKFEEKK